MKKGIGIIAVVVLLIGFFSISFAEETKETKEQTRGKEAMKADATGSQAMMSGGAMMDHKKMMAESAKHKMMMGSMMMGKSLVATADGGVVVMIGNKLLKYDKNLNLKNEVEIKVDTESMSKRTKDMREKCGMRQKTMKGASAAESKEASTADKISVHQMHHR